MRVGSVQYTAEKNIQQTNIQQKNTQQKKYSKKTYTQKIGVVNSMMAPSY